MGGQSIHDQETEERTANEQAFNTAADAAEELSTVAPLASDGSTTASGMQSHVDEPNQEISAQIESVSVVSAEDNPDDHPSLVEADDDEESVQSNASSSSSSNSNPTEFTITDSHFKEVIDTTRLL